MSSEQNRREPRLRTQVPVILTFGKKTVATTTEDISYRGLYVPMDEDFPALRMLVKVEIQLPNGAEAFTPHAMVVRHGDDYGKRGIGLEFFGRTESVTWDQFVRDTQQQPQAHLSSPSAPPPYQPPALPGFNPQQQAFAPPPFGAPTPGQQPFAQGQQPLAPPLPSFSPATAQPPFAQGFSQGGFPQDGPPQGGLSHAQPPFAPPQHQQYGQPPRGFGPPLPGQAFSPGSTPPLPAQGHHAAQFAASAPPHMPHLPSPPIIHGLTPPPPVPPPDGSAADVSFAHPGAPSWEHERKSAPPPLPPAVFTGADRRRHARFELPIEIRVRTSRSIHVAYGIDASLGGLSLCGSDLALNVGEHLILNLAQPGTPLSFRVEATVQRTVPAPHAGTFGYGVEFVSLEPARRTMLQEFYDASATALAARSSSS